MQVSYLRAMKEQEHAEICRAPVAIVTGASRGLGRGIALELARNGYSVAILFASNQIEAHVTLDLCESLRTDTSQVFHLFQLDISNPEDRLQCIEDIFKTFGAVDALVNNAGIAPRNRTDLIDMSIESFRELIRINLEGPHFLTQIVTKRWLEEAESISSKKSSSKHPENAPKQRLAGKRIIFITSISVDTVSLNRGEYCISKAGLSMSASLWAARLAPEGALVFEIRPGIMKTDMTTAVAQKYEKLIGEGLVPAKRWGTPEDVGKATRAVLSGDFDFAAGSVIYLDGGFHISRL